MSEVKDLIIKQLSDIQSELKAPKGQRNTFGNYNYRSCEDILEAVKPLLKRYGCSVMLHDEIIGANERVYVKATATIANVEGQMLHVSAYAREAAAKKGMDEAQITGAASSYARKYALNGLFLIDDTKDADSTNTHGADDPATEKQLELIRRYQDKMVLVAEFCKKEFGKTTLPSLSKQEASRVIEMLKQ